MALSAWQVNGCQRLKTSAQFGIGYKTGQVGKHKGSFHLLKDRNCREQMKGKRDQRSCTGRGHRESWVTCCMADSAAIQGELYV